MRVRLGLVCLGLMVSPGPVGAYDLETHAELTRLGARANVGGFSLETFVRNTLKLGTLETPLTDARGKSRSIVEWMASAAVEEDKPLCRSARHFFNPLTAQPWTTGGLTLSPNLKNLEHQAVFLHCKALSYPASVRWFQMPGQNGEAKGGGDWDWATTRKAYEKALTEPFPEERMAALVKVFQGIGHVMHLLQDSTVPAHSRNDTHLQPDPYERDMQLFVLGRLPGKTKDDFRAMASPPLTYPEAQLAIPVETFLLPLSRAWDTDRYTGSNPAVTTTLPIGSAEFTNANFPSFDTIFVGFPHPTLADIESGATGVTLPGFTQPRRYFRRRNAPTVEHYLVARRTVDPMTGQPIPGTTPYSTEDPLVSLDYGKHLLPRAVGYGAGAIRYFFRGGVSVTQPDPKTSVQFKNTGAEPVEGILTVYADDGNGIRVRLTEYALKLGAGGQSLVLGFPWDRVASDLKETSEYWGVFVGKMGAEQDAVFVSPLPLVAPPGRLANYCERGCSIVFIGVPPGSAPMIQSAGTPPQVIEYPQQGGPNSTWQITAVGHVCIFSISWTGGQGVLDHDSYARRECPL